MHGPMCFSQQIYLHYFLSPGGDHGSVGEIRIFRLIYLTYLCCVFCPSLKHSHLETTPYLSINSESASFLIQFNGCDAFSFSCLLDVVAMTANGQSHQIWSYNKLLLERWHQLPGALRKHKTKVWILLRKHLQRSCLVYLHIVSMALIDKMLQMHLLTSRCFVASWLRDISSNLVLMLRRCMSLSKDTRFIVASLVDYTNTHREENISLSNVNELLLYW